MRTSIAHPETRLRMAYAPYEEMKDGCKTATPVSSEVQRVTLTDSVLPIPF